MTVPYIEERVREVNRVMIENTVNTIPESIIVDILQALKKHQKHEQIEEETVRRLRDLEDKIVSLERHSNQMTLYAKLCLVAG